MQVVKNIILLLVAVTVTSAEILWPPKGALGNIDFRYPDHIVKPPPPCPAEGVYPHPSDCTWYYRCFTYLPPQYNAYRRAYFKCEPGTVFSDALDQCVFGSEFPNSCQTGGGGGQCDIEINRCQQYTLCPNPSQKVTKTLCQVANTKCKNDVPKALCSRDEYYDPNLRQCHPNPDRQKCAPVPACRGGTSKCSSRFYCDSRGEFIEDYLCLEATKCDAVGNLVPICARGSLYDPSRSQCVQMHKCKQMTAGCVSYETCESGVKTSEYVCMTAYKYSREFFLIRVCPPALFYMPYTDRCVDDPYNRRCPPCENKYNGCFVEPNACVNGGTPQSLTLCGDVRLCHPQLGEYTPCPQGSFYDRGSEKCVGTLADLQCQRCKENFINCEMCGGNMLCEKYDKCINNQQVSYCPQGLYYHANSTQCVTKPKECGSLTVLTDSKEIRCPTINLIPLEDWMLEKCSEVYFCDANNNPVKERTVLCSFFYRCEQDGLGKLTAVENKCLPGDIFSHSSKQCVKKPTSREICDYVIKG